MNTSAVSTSRCTTSFPRRRSTATERLPELAAMKSDPSPWANGGPQSLRLVAGRRLDLDHLGADAPSSCVQVGRRRTSSRRRPGYTERGVNGTATVIVRHDRLAAESSPYLLQHAAEPGRLVRVGTDNYARPRGDRPILLSIGYAACHWCHVRTQLFDHPAARGDERAFREHQGRPRGAARSGCRLHGRGRRDDRPRRLADDGLPHTEKRAVLRRDPPRRCPARPGRASGRRFRPSRPRIASGARTSRAPRSSWSKRCARPRAEAVDRPAHGLGARRGGAGATPSVRRGVGPASAARPVRRPRPSSSCSAATSSTWSRRRSTRWRQAACTISSAAASTATRRRRVAGAALREDALRQRTARPRVPARMGRHRRGALPRGRGDLRVHAPPARAAGRRVRILAGRGHEWRRGADVHLDRGRGRRRRAAAAVRARPLDHSRSSRPSCGDTLPFEERAQRHNRRATTRRSPPGTGWPSQRSPRPGVVCQVTPCYEPRRSSETSCSASFPRTTSA